MPQWIQAFASMGEGRATRSTVLGPLLFMICALSAGTGGLAAIHAPGWLLGVVSGLLVLVVVLAAGFFAHFALKSPDLLRSEKYAIRKMEIEKAAIGDNLMGMLDVEPKALPEPQHGRTS